ncbi:MAG: Plug domain-containing protein [Bacteroidetes bacterium]|nr:Plug domain-containing protein [Bacteroidota bacterium]
MKKILSLLLLTLIGVVANAQQAIQRGRVTRDASQNQSTTSSTSLAKIKIRLSDDSQIGLTDSAGYFSPSETLFPGDLIFGYRNGEKLFGYKWQDQTDGNNNTPNQGIDLQIIIIGNGLDLMGEVRIRISQGGPFLEEIKPQKLQLNPSMGNGIESLIKTFIGASSGNEMSSQYTVRGGNYDENLIYVNDIEILRPQLISSGQQEGLSFINSDLVQSVKFSAGGFGAQYGDKMSSVLDVDYIPKTLNVKGNYSMRFNDLQTQVTYKVHRKLYIDFLGNLASNNYTLNPISRSTTFGTIQNAYQLDVGMGGQESLKYLYGMGSLTLRYTPNVRNEFKWMLNHTSIEEQEVFDVEGLYYLSQLDRDMGSKTYGKPLKTLGYGYYIDHGRNRMTSGVTQFAHIGKIGKSTDAFSWNYSVRLNKESVVDKIAEWYYNDSAGYNIAPFGRMEDSILFDNYILAKNTLSSYRGKAHISGQWRLSKRQQIWLTSGIRTQYWTVNREMLIMPRMSLSWEPHKSFNERQRSDAAKKPDVLYKLAIGAYHQPGFYRELRNFDGVLNRKLLAQKSWHIVTGYERYFFNGGRKFKYTAEAYYKGYQDLVPYLFDNIRIRYYGTNSATGFAWGVDQRIYGEFTKGLESWFTLGIMQTKEKITYNDALTGNTITTDYLRRPTDRRVNLGAVFQDQMPNNPSLRVNLTLNIGTGIPYYLDGKARYTTTPNTIPPYRRVDIGFSKIFEPKKYKWVGKLGMTNAWLSIDIFNLLDINNVIGYSWVKDLQNNRYGVPDYLTGRRLNIRLYGSF